MTPLTEAIEAFKGFLSGVPSASRVVILHDSDADGVTAGVVLQRALERAGYSSISRVIPNRERDAWTDANRELVRQAHPEALFVLDLGSRADRIVDDVPTCFIDHHRPEVVANETYLPGRVNFSMRSASGVNLLDFLGGFDLGTGEGSYARGHDQATGGSLPIERWNLLLSRFGFGPEMYAQ